MGDSHGCAGGGLGPSINKLSSFGIEQPVAEKAGGSAEAGTTEEKCEKSQGGSEMCPDFFNAWEEDCIEGKLADVEVDGGIMSLAGGTIGERMDSGEMALQDVSASCSSRASLENCTEHDIYRTARFMVLGHLVAETQFKVGTAIHPPSLDEISSKYGMPWLKDIFISWDADLSSVMTDFTVAAVLKKSHKVTVNFDGAVYTVVEHVPDGVWVKDVLKSVAESGDFKTPFFQNYLVCADSKIVSGDVAVNIRTAAGNGSSTHSVTFCFMPSDVEAGTGQGAGASDMCIIKIASVEDGCPAELPSDAEISASGLKTPFSKYYYWDTDTSSVHGDLYVYALALGLAEKGRRAVSALVGSVKTEGVQGTLSSAAFECKRFLFDGFEMFKEHRMNKGFGAGCLIQDKDFAFRKLGNELMLMAFSGVSMDVEIPAYVNGLPVRYVSSEFLNGGIGIFNNYKWRSFKNSINVQNIGNMSLHDLRSIISGIRSIILPNTLLSIPRYCFYGCSSLKELVVPASVRMVAASAFDFCSIEKLLFNGPSPKGLDMCRLSCRVYVRSEHYDTFSGINLV